jgi:hypothetical protein
MNVWHWTALGVTAIGTALTVVGLVIRMRDRDELRTKFTQYLPGN